MCENEVDEEVEPVGFKDSSEGREVVHRVVAREENAREVDGRESPEVGLVQESFSTWEETGLVSSVRGISPRREKNEEDEPESMRGETQLNASQLANVDRSSGL